MPEVEMRELPDGLRWLWSRVEYRYRVCFIAALISGLFTHFFMLANKITNLDDLGCVPYVGGGGSLGRWLQYDLHPAFSEWSAPAVNGAIAIAFFALAACFMVGIAGIRSGTGAGLLAVMLMTFPGSASNLYYMFLAGDYALAVLMSCFGVWLTIRFRFGWIACVILQMYSMAIYQAYFALATSLFLLALLAACLDGEAPADIVKRGFLYLFTLAGSMGAYLASLRLVGEELSDYKGLRNIGHTTAVSWFHAVLRAYHRVLQYFFTSPESYQRWASFRFNQCLVIVFLLLLVAVCLQKRIWADARRLLLLFGALALLPLAMGLVYVMAPDISHASTIMTLSFAAFYFAVILVGERLRLSELPWERAAVAVLAAATAFFLLAEAYVSYRMINNAYYRSYLAQMRMAHYYSRILSMLEQQEGFQYGDPIAILGGFYPERMPLSSYDLEGKLLADFEGATLEDHLFLPPNRVAFIRLFLGVDSPEPMEDKRIALMETPEFAEMPNYPAEGCIRKIQDTWVVKIERDDR